jgi:hypothetical protein
MTVLVDEDENNLLRVDGWEEEVGMRQDVKGAQQVVREVSHEGAEEGWGVMAGE